MAKRNFRFCIEATLGLALWLMPTLSRAVSEEPPVDSIQTDTIAVEIALPVEIRVDTVLYEPGGAVSPARQVTNAADLETTLSQRPMVALTKSLLVPGLGQIGNRSYKKAILFAGLEIWFFTATRHYARQASEAHDYYESSTDLANRRDGFFLFDNKRKNRNKYAWYAGLTIFISMFDAYVDAHMSGSPVDSRNDKYSLELVPHDDGVIAQLSLNF